MSIYTESIREKLKQAFSMPDEAVEWLCMLFDAIQMLDDVADGDPVDRSVIDSATWNLLVAMPQNAFFRVHSQALLPVMATQILKWQAANDAEKTGHADALSFSWRAGFYDVVLCAVNLVHGPNATTPAASAILRLYGESFEEYLKEFQNA